MVEDKWKIKRYLPPLKTPLNTIDSEVLVEVEDVLQFFFLLQQKVPLLFGSGFKCSESSFREVHDLHDVLSVTDDCWELTPYNGCQSCWQSLDSSVGSSQSYP